MSGRDHYEVLGVPRSASTGDIQRAYRARALRYHPDVSTGPDAGRRFREVVDAYDVLHDPAQRARYDAMSRTARDLEASAVPRPITGRPSDVPRFVDEDHEVGGDDLISTMLQEVLLAGWATPAWVRAGEWWPSTRWTTEAWRWR